MAATPSQYAELIEENEDSPRKIPKVKFYEDISVLCGDNSPQRIEQLMKLYNELHSKFRLMSASLTEQHVGMKTRTQNLEQAQQAILMSETKAKSENPNYKSLFKAADCVYTEATITDPNNVLLWLGSNTLMEYTLDEAKSVLAKNLESTIKNMVEIGNDIKYVREQITVVEVAISRLHNYTVHLRKIIPEK